MTEIEQRIAIAKFCGVIKLSDGPWTGLVPEYLADLNAMHEVEKRLSIDQCRVYNETLAKICVPIASLFRGVQADGYLFHATAAQRAEALLKTIGRWMPDRLAKLAQLRESTATGKTSPTTEEILDDLRADRG
jgi:hypothetical protein